MRLQTAWAIVLAAAVLVPLARAGDEANPEISDSLDARITDGSLDFVSAWFEPHPTGLAFTIKVREATDLKPDHGWGIGFNMGGIRHLPILAVDSKGKLRSCACVSGGLGGGADTFPDDLRDVAFHPGKPAYFSALIPYSAVPGLGPGAVLQDVGAASLTRGAGKGWSDYDGNNALDGYAVQRVLLPPGLAHALPYVLGGTVLLAAGATGTWLILRRKAPAPSRLEPAPASEHAPAPAARRMSLKPPP